VELLQISAVEVMKNLQYTLHKEGSREVAGAGDHLRECLEFSLHPIHEFGNSNVIRERGWTNAELVQRLLVFLVKEFQLLQNFGSVFLRGCILLRKRFSRSRILRSFTLRDLARLALLVRRSSAIFVALSCFSRRF
jgi:hypothetical protein